MAYQVLSWLDWGLNTTDGTFMLLAIVVGIAWAKKVKG